MARLGLAVPLGTTFGCGAQPASAEGGEPETGSVLIIGAGAAGLAAGYLLAQRGVPFQILEASPRWGGRMKRTADFADFPIPLGAEWLHAAEAELTAIINDPARPVPVETVGYAPEEPAGWFEDGELSFEPTGATPDRKFVGSTWYDFFAQAIVPYVQDRIVLETPVAEVQHGPDGVRLLDRDGGEWTADAVIVTVPLPVLKRGDLRFSPPLPAERQAVIAQAPVWGGIKVFMEFTEQFYPAVLAFPDSNTATGQRLYYDAAFGQDSQTHVMGLFAVGAQAQPYQALAGDALRDHVLAELDEVFAGRATPAYVKHIAQDWSAEPFIHGAYLADNAPDEVAEALAEPVGDTLYFAGEAYADSEDWGGVHNATQAARRAVAALLGG